MRFLAFIGFIAIVAAIAAGVYFFAGYYNVAGTAGDTPLVASALIRVRIASIDRHALDAPSISLSDPAMVQAGARAFNERGCVNCHGGPGAPWAKFSEGLHPSPPDLKEVADKLEPRHIFWIVKNGINMTGMPSFGPTGVPDDEIWKIVAFVKKLPGVSEQDFKTWTQK
jgi:mono/diheme cytochrome c family protein